MVPGNGKWPQSEFLQRELTSNSLPQRSGFESLCIDEELLPLVPCTKPSVTPAIAQNSPFPSIFLFKAWIKCSQYSHYMSLAGLHEQDGFYGSSSHYFLCLFPMALKLALSFPFELISFSFWCLKKGQQTRGSVLNKTRQNLWNHTKVYPQNRLLKKCNRQSAGQVHVYI